VVAPAPGRSLSPPLWAVLMVPFGLTVGFGSIAVPYVLRVRGLDMSTVSAVASALQLPHIVKLFWSPVLDAGPRRRTWYFGSIAVGAVCLGAAALMAPDPSGPRALLWLYTATLVLAQAAVATSGSAVLALMAIGVPEARRGIASGWQTAGNLVGTQAGGALAAWMMVHASRPVTAAVLAAGCVACAIPAAFVDEVPPPKRAVLPLLAGVFREVVDTLRSEQGWTGMLLCLSPVGTGALTNLFSALALDYAPTESSAEELVIFVTGLLGGVVSALGSLVGGYVSDRMNRRLAYVVFGGVTALSAVALLLCPATPAAFAVGCLAYQLFNVVCYVTFYAFVLDLLGHRRGVGTQLALYVGASNLAAAYVTRLDGWSYDRARALFPQRRGAGRSGMLAMDALSTFVGIAALGALTLHLRRRAERRAAG
jgi:MFS transporter, PAT family, beta-lactamase induction signal transducer AmpG